MKHWATWMCVTLGLLPLTGCSWNGKGGVRHTLILGVGFVSRAATNGVTVQDVRSIGLSINNGAHVGLTQEHNLEIDPNVASNTIISIRATPFSLRVTNFSTQQTQQLTKEKE